MRDFVIADCEITTGEIAAMTGAKLRPGDPADKRIHNIAPLDTAGLSMVDLWSEPLVAVLPTRHPLAAREAIPLAARTVCACDAWSAMTTDRAYRKALQLDPNFDQAKRNLQICYNKAQSLGRGRARRWLTPPAPGFTATLLMPAPLPGGSIKDLQKSARNG